MKNRISMIFWALASVLPMPVTGQDGGAIETIVGDQKVERTFHENGQKKSEARKKNDGKGKWVTDGVVRTWYPSGAKRGVLLYKMGVPDGVWKTFYENGNQFDEQVFEAGVRTGTAKRFYESGQLMDESTFKSIGAVITEVHMKVFHANGKLAQKGKWRREAAPGKKPKSVKDGEWTYFDAQGELEKTEIYVDGKLVTKDGDSIVR